MELAESLPTRVRPAGRSLDRRHDIGGIRLGCSYGEQRFEIPFAYRFQPHVTRHVRQSARLIGERPPLWAFTDDPDEGIGWSA
ncbi:hypothetical protein Sar04_08820 [Salinispora arenicola]|uniref:DUF2236 domain-containing protein n=1 Tax=Salinispora arenicola TaxID=168697 RepID=A0ABQ4JQ06_SALAC|nr:hypothetical protein Sar04_08820 [Salinispora arenicola]